MVLHLDYETASELDLTRVGAYRYAQDSSTRVLIASYAFDDGPVEQWLPAEGDFMPAELEAALRDDTTVVEAWNANFERQITIHVLGIPAPARKYRCVMVRGMACGFPGALSTAAIAAGLPADKQKLKTGRALIRVFCAPRKPTKNKPWTWNTPEREPDKWAQFKAYGAQDIVTERSFGRRIRRFPLPAREQRLWELDQDINDFGVRVDVELVQAAMKMGTRHIERLSARVIELTGIQNPNSIPQFLQWLQTEDFGEAIPDLQKKTVEGLLKRPVLDSTFREVLELRQQIAKTSLSKYKAIMRSICDDGRVRGIHQFMGAFRTGRWAGRILQGQNLPNPVIEDYRLLEMARRLVLAGDYETLQWMFPSVAEVLSTLIRTTIIPTEGRRIFSADFAAIEAVCTAWIADCSWRLEVFRTHGKIYEASAATAFKLDLREILEYRKRTGKHHPIRKKGKIIELACGFGGSEGAMVRMGALEMGLAREELLPMVEAWRAASPEIVKTWYDIERAAKAAIRNPNQVFKAGKCEFLSANKMLQIKIPSGRTLFYVKPRLEPNGKYVDIHYMGMHPDTRQWCEIDTYGGKLFENIIQAFARDCFCDTLLQTPNMEHVFVSMLVHDELSGEHTEGASVLPDLLATMSRPLPYAPGLPLRAAGYQDAPFYFKE